MRDTDDLDALQADLIRRGKVLGDMSTMLAEIGHAMNETVADTLRSGAVKPDAPGTLKTRHEEHIPGDLPLMARLDLFKSFDSPNSATYSMFSLSPFELIIGTSAPGGEEAEFGTRHELQREFLPTETERLSAIIDQSGALDRFVMELTK